MTEESKNVVEINPENLSIRLPDGTELVSDEGDINEFLDKALDFIKSPEFVGKILPVIAEGLLRKHIEVKERLAIEKQKVMLKGRYELQFLIARAVIGVILIGTVATLTIYGHLATETTIVTLMATLGFIMWGKGN